MKNTITIGTIWKDNRTGKTFEVTAVNNKIQLSPTTGEQVYSIMSEKSLRKNYKLIAMSLKEFRPEPAVVTAVAEEPENVELKIEKKEEITICKKITRKAGKVQLEDGTIVSAKDFIINICKKTPEETYKRATYAFSIGPWLIREKTLLEQYNAKVI